MSESAINIKTPYFRVMPLLGAILVVLKVLGKISLSWWWVLFPFYFGLLAILIFLFGGAIAVGLIGIAAAILEKK